MCELTCRRQARLWHSGGQSALSRKTARRYKLQAMPVRPIDLVSCKATQYPSHTDVICVIIRKCRHALQGWLLIVVEGVRPRVLFRVDGMKSL
jgi:hypothetical protein